MSFWKRKEEESETFTPDSLPEAIESIKGLMESGELSQASIEVDKLINKNPDSGELYYYSGSIKCLRGNNADGTADFKSAATLGDESSRKLLFENKIDWTDGLIRTKINEAVELKRDGNFSEAEKVLQKLNSEYSYHAGVVMSLGKIKACLQRYDEAESLLRQAFLLYDEYDMDDQAWQCSDQANTIAKRSSDRDSFIEYMRAVTANPNFQPDEVELDLEEFHQKYFHDQYEYIINNSKIISPISDGALQLHLSALQGVKDGSVDESVLQFSRALELYSQIPISSSSDEFVLCRGYCLLSILILDQYTDEDAKATISVGYPSVLAFTYFWLAFEISNYSNYWALFAIAELFRIPTACMMIGTAAMLDLSQTNIPEFYTVLFLDKIFYYLDLYDRSKGDMSHKRWVFPDMNDDRSLDSERLKYHQALKIKAADMMADATIKSDQKTGHGLEPSQLIARLKKHISDDEPISYEELVEIIIRNIKRASGGDEYALPFTQSSVGIDQAIEDENIHAIYTALYAYDRESGEKMKKSERIATELIEIAKNYATKEKYGCAHQLAIGASYFTSTKITDPLVKDYQDLCFKHEIGESLPR